MDHLYQSSSNHADGQERGGEVGETKELYRLPQTSTPSTNTCSLLVRLLIKIQFKNKHYFELNTKMFSIWSNIVNYLLLEG